MHKINCSETLFGLSREFWVRMRENVDKLMYQSTSGGLYLPANPGFPWYFSGAGGVTVEMVVWASLQKQLHQQPRQSGENRKHWLDF